MTAVARASSRPLAALSLAALALAPLDAAALSRTVHVRYGILNTAGHDIYVGVSAPYARDLNHYFPNMGPELGDLRTSFTGDLFGAAQRYSRDSYGFRLPHRTQRGMDAVDTIHTGHTRHYTVALYERVDGELRAFAYIDWAVKMNLRGITECHTERLIDPDQRLSVLHKRTDEGFTGQEIAEKFGADLSLREKVLGSLGFPPIGEADETPEQFFDRLARWALAQLVDIPMPGLVGPGSAIVDVTAFAVESKIKSAPGSCVTQLWVMPPVPPERRTLTSLFMHGWGGAGYSWTGDFNGDAIPDIASASGATLFVSQSRRNASPSSWEWRPQTINTGSNAWGDAGYTFVGDFDGDHKDDIASADGGRVHLRRASAGFTIESLPAVAPWPMKCGWGSAGYTFVGDFDGDGKHDIASADGGRIYLRQLVGDRFTCAPASVLSRWGGAGYTRVGDFNGDGKHDIASMNGRVVYMRLGQARGFSHQEWAVPGRWGGSGYTFVGDFNSDGKDDIASANGGDVHMLLSTGAGFTPAIWRVPANWGGAGYTRVGDFNGDGRADIASASGGAVFLNLSTGAGFNQTRWVVPDWWGDAGYTFIGDFDRDGRSDIATGRGPEVQVKLARP